MKHILCSNGSTNNLTTAILIKEDKLVTNQLETNYIYPLEQLGVNRELLIAFSLSYINNKASVSLITEYCEKLLKVLDSLNIKNLYVADSAYFKKLAKQTKADQCLGDVYPCAIKGYEHINVILGINYGQLLYNQNAQISLDTSLNTLAGVIAGKVTKVGANVIKHCAYPDTDKDIETWLQKLLKYPALTLDIETFDLKHYKAGIGSVGFAWNENEGIAFCVDLKPSQDNLDKAVHSVKSFDIKRRELLKQFLVQYKGNLKYHNAAYDIKVLIYQLWMKDITDHEGLLEGLDVMTRNFDCTKLVTYLATNTCSGNKLSLKDTAQPHLGNYAEDVKDIRRVPISDLLEYNLKDCLGTWYTWNTKYPLLISENQKELYDERTDLNFKESLICIIQMELTGMPIHPDKVIKAENQLLKIRNEAFKTYIKSPFVEQMKDILINYYWEDDYKKRYEAAVKRRKKSNSDKPITIKYKDKKDITFTISMGSGKQLQVLLYDVLKLPVINTTDTGQPSVDNATLEALLQHTKDQKIKEIIQNVIDYAKVNKLLTAFINKFKEAVRGSDGLYYLFGSFNLGGTKSGRLSSSEPNLQTIPSGSTYAKLIKMCFGGNKKWLFCGADFASLEDRISALTTKDPNKLAVYTEGLDGHSARAFYYYSDQMPDIVAEIKANPENKVAIINSIKQRYPELRDESKQPTFALTYQGTVNTLMFRCGLTKKKSNHIFDNYQDLYKVSIAWVKDKLEIASDTGYIEGAFGLKLRTPKLQKSVLNSKVTPYEVAAESRTAGNALGQSYGLLNSRVANEVMKKVRNHPEYKTKIKISAQIHDACYFLIANEIGVVTWLNKILTDEMLWQDLPDIKHPTVGLGGELDLFYPNWANPINLKPHWSKSEIKHACIKASKNLKGT